MAYFLEVLRQGLGFLSETNTTGLGGGDPLRLTLTAFLFTLLLRYLGEKIRHEQS